MNIKMQQKIIFKQAISCHPNLTILHTLVSRISTKVHILTLKTLLSDFHETFATLLLQFGSIHSHKFWKLPGFIL